MAITPVSLFSDEWTTLNSIQSANSASSAERADKKASSSQGTAFDTFLNAAVDMYKEADSLQLPDLYRPFHLSYRYSSHGRYIPVSDMLMLQV